MDGWNTTFLLGRPIFRGYVSFREGNEKYEKLAKNVFFSADVLEPTEGPTTTTFEASLGRRWSSIWGIWGHVFLGKMDGQK